MGGIPIRWLHRAVVAMAGALLFSLAPATAITAAADRGAPYYLSLGDSLAQGVQPTSTGVSVITNRGYVDDLYRTERRRVEDLKLKKLGCPGETTTSMLTGGICPYPLGNQVAQAVAFLHTHRVALVTIDIGGNNVDNCVSGGGINPTCIVSGIGAIGTDLPQILGALRRAAGPKVPIVGMNYYDAFLAAWLQGAAGQALATASVGVATQFNGVLGQVYGAFRVPVADVQSAFQTTNFTPVPVLGLPTNVAIICALTWMCAPPPVGPNIHANRAGYTLIAVTFARTIGRLDSSDE